MEENKKNSVRIYSYNKVWKIENKLYSIQNIVLPVPVKPVELLYFLSSAAALLLLSYVLPLLRDVPVIIRYVIAPYAITQFMLKKKLDGKSPQKYLLGYIKYLLTRGEYYERFSPKSGAREEKIKIGRLCGMRGTEGDYYV